MIRRSASTALILFIVISTNGQSQQQSQQDFSKKIQEPQKHEEISKQQDKSSPAPKTVPPQRPPENLKESTHDDSKQKQKELYKKWWEITQNPVEVFTGALAIFTIVLVAVSIYQVAVIRRTTRRQLRAYVFIDSVDIINAIAPPENASLPEGTPDYQPTIGPIVRIVIKNSGQTPAYDMICWGHIYFSDYPLTSPLPYIDQKVVSPPIKSKLPVPAEGKTFKDLVMPLPLTATQIGYLREATHAIYVYGNINYRDIFGKNRFSSFRYFANVMTGISHLRGYMTGCEAGNEAN
ncbi:MAG: hypothetical protein ACLQPD_24665 [Desulfomonilaceae bacterium]